MLIVQQGKHANGEQEALLIDTDVWQTSFIVVLPNHRITFLKDKGLVARQSDFYNLANLSLRVVVMDIFRDLLQLSRNSQDFYSDYSNNKILSN